MPLQRAKQTLGVKEETVSVAFSFGGHVTENSFCMFGNVKHKKCIYQFWKM